jgi:hypothetical protein
MPAGKDDIDTQEQEDSSTVLGKRAHEQEAGPAADGNDSGKEVTWSHETHVPVLHAPPR